MTTRIGVVAATSAWALVALSTVAFAQVRPADVQCKGTETQAECHARLKCTAYEELEDCQKRLLRCKADESMGECVKRAQSQGNAGNQNNSNNDRDNGRDNDRGNDRDNGRGNDRDNSRDNDRGNDRDNRRDNDRGDRGDRGRDNSRSNPDSGRGRRDRGRRGGRQGGRGFQANKVFGLGLELGQPSGLTGKYFVSESGALDFGLGAIYSHYYYGDGIHIYGDYLFHPVSLVSADAFELPFYVGVGLRFWDFDYCVNNVCGYGGSAVGLRIPFGIAFDFNRVPLDIFFQFVPVIDFTRGDYYDRYRDRTHFGVDFSLGLRYWFK